MHLDMHRASLHTFGIHHSIIFGSIRTPDGLLTTGHETVSLRRHTKTETAAENGGTRCTYGELKQLGKLSNDGFMETLPKVKLSHAILSKYLMQH